MIYHVGKWKLKVKSESDLPGGKQPILLSFASSSCCNFSNSLIEQVRVFAENELGRSKEGRVLQVFFRNHLVTSSLFIRGHYVTKLSLTKTMKSTFSQFGTDGERPEGTARWRHFLFFFSLRSFLPSQNAPEVMGVKWRWRSYLVIFLW